ncbi:MAG: group III truncated hemoglobin [Flavobacteriales bacterium]|nr:group III truncated hemoglobin [Flavobacteriales bacterium]
MKHDISTIDDIDLLVRSFYQRARPDESIGHFFANLDWDHHIPRIVSFWRMVLLGDREFQGDPMTAHIQLARERPMAKAHFERWLMHWEATVNDLFAGPKADEAKQRARTIAAVMAHKVSASSS